MRDVRNIATGIPGKDSIHTALKVSLPGKDPQMTVPARKTSPLRRSQSLSLRPKLVSSDSGRSEPPSECPRVRKMEPVEQTTQFYVLQPKPGQPKSYEGKLLQYPRPVVPLRQDHVPTIAADDGQPHVKQKQESEQQSVQLSPKSILKNYSAASYRNPVLVSRIETDSAITKQSSLKSGKVDLKGKQLSPRGHFRYRLSLTAPSSANDKRVTFDEEVSYINENSLYRRRHSTPSLPLL